MIKCCIKFQDKKPNFWVEIKINNNLILVNLPNKKHLGPINNSAVKKYGELMRVQSVF